MHINVIDDIVDELFIGIIAAAQQVVFVELSAENAVYAADDLLHVRFNQKVREYVVRNEFGKHAHERVL